MKTVIAVLALLVASCCAVPAPVKQSAPILLQKGEAPVEEYVEMAPEEPTGVFWVPFWDFFSNMFSKKEELPEPNNEVRMARPARLHKKPERAEFDNSDEFLDELNHFHFGSSEETRDLVEVDSEEVRHANYKAPEHVRDAILYNHVMPKRADFEDYGEFLEETHRHLMTPHVHKKAEPKVKSTWNSWFGKW